MKTAAAPRLSGDRERPSMSLNVRLTSDEPLPQPECQPEISSTPPPADASCVPAAAPIPNDPPSVLKAMSDEEKIALFT
jgi:hypothetical protein